MRNHIQVLRRQLRGGFTMCTLLRLSRQLVGCLRKVVEHHIKHSKSYEKSLYDLYKIIDALFQNFASAALIALFQFRSSLVAIPLDP